MINTGFSDVETTKKPLKSGAFPKAVLAEDELRSNRNRLTPYS